MVETSWATSQEALEWKEFFIPVLSGISLAFCLFAQVLLCILSF
jgi:hypothetical protein